MSLDERIGYVLKVYPRFSETFVVTEILARERAGEDLAIFALRPTSDARFHPQIAQVQAPVEHLGKPAKLSEGWTLMTQAQAELPEFAARFASLLPVMARMESTEVYQSVDLALRAHRAQLTHLHVHFASMAARVTRIAAELTGLSYSVTAHAKDLFHDDVDPILLEDVLGHADHVVTISDFNRRFLAQRYPGVQPRVHLVRNGLNLEQFTYSDPQPPANRLRVLAVGRLVEKKGFGDLISAAQVLAGGDIALDVRIAGDGELRQQLQAHINGAGLSQSVHLLGPRSQSEIQELLAWADVMVAPCVIGADGNADGLPTVLLEAMATGVPVIATAVTGIPEVVHAGAGGEPQTGILLEPGDVGGLAQALVQVAHPDFSRQQIARNARAVIEADYDTARQVQILRQLACTELATAGVAK